MRPDRASAIGAVVLAMALAGCARAPEQTEGDDACAASWAEAAVVDGDTLVEGSIGDASNLIPMLASDSASHRVAGLIFDGMLTYDKTLSELEPRLAERWEVAEEGRVLTFHLRDDVRWQDGAPFTAHDVEFGFRTIIDPETLTAYAEDYRQVESFELVDEHAFRVRYAKPYAPALASWGAMVVLPRHLLAGKDINQAIEFARSPVGLGEYRIESWETGRKISVRVNEDYYRGRPHIERVVTRIIPDSQTQFLELKSGGLDTMGLTPLQFQRQTDTGVFRTSFRKYRYLTNSYTYLGYNLKNPLFEDVRVRRALTHAIDKEEIVKVVLLGLGSPAKVPYKPGTVWFNEEVEDLGYDPERARELLAEAGWTDSNGDGVLDRDGKPFAFKILTNQGNDQRLKAATVVQQRLQQVGVKVDVRVVEWAAFLNEFVDKRKFDAVVLGWSLDADPDQYIIWHSSKIQPKEFNFVTYANPEVDELLEQGRRTFDADERKRLYDRFQEILVADQPYTFLYYAESTPVVHCRFQGIEPAPAGISYNFEDWWVPKPLQKYSLSAAP